MNVVAAIVVRPMPPPLVPMVAALADDVLGAARRYADAEDLVARALDEGAPLATAYRHKRSIIHELRR